MLLVTRRSFTRGDVQKEKIIILTLSLAKQRQKTEAIFKTYELSIYEVRLHYLLIL
jgi:hypothetical protein